MPDVSHLIYAKHYGLEMISTCVKDWSYWTWALYGINCMTGVIIVNRGKVVYSSVFDIAEVVAFMQAGCEDIQSPT